ncbi:MAG: hypothetical protein JNL92_02955 [Opitutaceae bacterium]|nr:hypothetical protein [Opitutaceae bacterium]
MLLAAGIGISLVSYLRLSSTSLRLAHRSLLGVSALNVAETGLEHAMYAFSQSITNGVPLATAWNGWTTDTTAHTAKRRFPGSGGFDLGAGTIGYVHVFVQNYDLADTPVVVAKASVSGIDGSPPVTKTLEIRLARRSLWGYGLVGKTSVHLDSNAKVDSWISDPDQNAATAAVAYSSGVRRDRGNVGVVAAADGAISLASNSEIYGTASTGGGQVTAAGNVRIYGASSPPTPKVDLSRIQKDFSCTFPTLTVPTPATINEVTSSWTTTMSLPRAGDVAFNGVYYYNFAAGHGVSLASNKTLTVNSPVVLIFKNHQGVPTFTMSSNADVSVMPDKSMTIYTNGDITFNSNNDINVGNEAKHFMIYGTSATGQNFTFDSNVQVYGCIYAPNAAITLNSNTDIFGAMIGNTIELDSNAEVHYDESLANVGNMGGLRVTRWKELQTAAERQAYEANLAF